MASRPYRDRPPVDPTPGRPPLAARIGSLQSLHAPPPIHRALLGPLLIAGLIVGVGVALGGPIGILVAVAVVTFAVLAIGPVRIRGFSAELYTQGLVLVRNGDRRVIAFEDVKEMWFDIAPLHSEAGAYLRALRLVDFSGEEYRVPLAVNEGVTLGNRIIAGCSGPLLLEARRALGEGETLTFGRIQIDRAGIKVGSAQIHWRDLRLAVVSHARVHLYRRFPLVAWRTVRLGRIPNPAVFAGLVAQCVARTRVDDRLLAPLASDAEVRRAYAEGGDELALREMLIGGIIGLAGITITWATYSANRHAYVIAWGPVLYGAVRFVRGLVALSTAPRKCVAGLLARALAFRHEADMPLVSHIKIWLTTDERAELESIGRSQTAPARDVQRARIILALAKNMNIGRVAENLHLTRDCVRKWAKRFERRRLAGLVDNPRSGRPPCFSPRSGNVRDQACVRAA